MVLDAGTNDLCSAYFQGTTVAAKVYAIACQYADIPSVRHVILGEVIRRGDGKANSRLKVWSSIVNCADCLRQGVIFTRSDIEDLLRISGNACSKTKCT